MPRLDLSSRLSLIPPCTAAGQQLPPLHRLCPISVRCETTVFCVQTFLLWQPLGSEPLVCFWRSWNTPDWIQYRVSREEDREETVRNRLFQISISNARLLTLVPTLAST